MDEHKHSAIGKHLRDVHNPSDKDLRDQYHPEEFEIPWKAGLLNLRNTLYQRKELS